ncbi:hypothetical protein niasHS_011639 [Heterodera schachtii]|uniref:B30.2/SPRY domain-containing protein n=1 Tax=Heterodera schachtii TaxID=97005 RepID=A0ABD2IFD5_HETSC
MSKRKASSMLLSSSSESAGVSEQNQSAEDNDSGQNEVIFVPSSADDQHHKQQLNKLVEKCAKMEAEMNVTKLKLENRTLKAELKQRELMDELKALQAMVAKMEEQKPNYVSLEQFESILGRIGELENHKKHQREKQQQQEEDDEEEEEEGTATSTSQRRFSRPRASTTQQTEFSAKLSEFEKKQTAKFKAHLTKIEKQHLDLVTPIKAKVAALEERQKNVCTFNAALREQMGNELLKTVHPNLRVNIAEELLNAQEKNCWDLRFCNNNLKIIDAKQLLIQHKGAEKGSCTVYAQNAIPVNIDSGIFYFEIKIVNVESLVTVGLGTKSMPLQGMPELWPRSCTYRSDGIFFIEKVSWANGKARCSRGDVAGFGLNLATRQIVFTKNGIRIDTSDLFFYPSHLYDYYRSLYPCVSLSDPGDLIEANFGPTFKFDPTKKQFYQNIPKNCWDADACHSDLEITDTECLTVHYKGVGNGLRTVFAKCAAPLSVAGIFYYEITVTNEQLIVIFGFATKPQQIPMPLDGTIKGCRGTCAYENNAVYWVDGIGRKIGLGTKSMPLQGMPELWPRSCAYRSDGIFFIEKVSWANGKARCSRGDVAGFGLNLATRQIVFTKNGIRIDTSDLFFYPSHLYDYYRSLYPCVSLSDPGDLIEANFGPTFKFDPTKKQFYQNIPKNCWDADACHSDLEITDTECLTVHYKGVGNGLRTVFAKCAAPLSVAGIFYYEITVTNEQLIVIFGFATKPQQIPMPLDGTIKGCRGTCAYENNAVYWVDGIGRKSRQTFSGGDTVGCGINLATQHIFFTKNGKRLDFTIMLSSLTIYQQQQQLFPFVILGDSDDKIEANFGPNFKYDFKSFY